MEPKRPNNDSNRHRQFFSDFASPDFFDLSDSIRYRYTDIREIKKLYQSSSRLEEPVPAWQLRNLAATPVGRRVMSLIANGVALASWSVSPPAAEQSNRFAQQRAQELSRALQRPNDENADSYVLFTKAVLQDLIVLGYGAVERAFGNPKTQPFWLWETDAALVAENPEWTLQTAKQCPRYFFGDPSQPSQLISLMDSELFLVRHDKHSHQSIPPSPFRVAYHLVTAWLGLCNFQDAQTGKALRNRIITLLNATESETASFRDYWMTGVEQQGRIPITGKAAKITRLGAKNDPELFLKYEKKLLKLFALAFNLTNQDLGVSDRSNDQADQAAVDVGISQTFQEAIRPYIQTLNRSFTDNVISYFEPGFKFGIKATRPLPEKLEIKTAINLYRGNIITRNQARMRIGMETAGLSGDLYSDGSFSE